MTLKNYIRKWSNWVIDFHWIFVLKYLLEALPTEKLYFFIKHYPILDNFILNWMWWSYTLNRDLEVFTKDPFRGIGSMPWLINDINNNSTKKVDNNNSQTKINSTNNVNGSTVIHENKKDKNESELNSNRKECENNQDLIDSNSNEKKSQPEENQKKPNQPSKFFQFNEYTIRTIGNLFLKNSDELDKFEVNRNRLFRYVIYL